MESTTLNSLSNHNLGDLLKNNRTGTGRVGCANEVHITHAIVSVIQSARLQGQSLEEVMAELMADDALLDRDLRCLLGDIVAQAWEKLP